MSRRLCSSGWDALPNLVFDSHEKTGWSVSEIRKVTMAGKNNTPFNANGMRTKPRRVRGCSQSSFDRTIRSVAIDHVTEEKMTARVCIASNGW
jgi:hypothetical protein